MHIRLKDELGIIKAAAKLPAGGGESVDSLPASAREAVGCLLQGGFSLWSRCVGAYFSPAFYHLSPWPMPGLAPGLAETVGQTALSLVKYLSGNNITKIVGQLGSGRLAAVSGLHICRFWRSS
ncbi:unnamed protein product, partial [marine sediment metagenome]